MVLVGGRADFASEEAPSFPCCCVDLGGRGLCVAPWPPNARLAVAGAHHCGHDAGLPRSLRCPGIRQDRPPLATRMTKRLIRSTAPGSSPARGCGRRPRRPRLSSAKLSRVRACRGAQPPSVAPLCRSIATAALPVLGCAGWSVLPERPCLPWRELASSSWYRSS